MLHQNLGDDYAMFIHSVLIPYYVHSGQYQEAERLLVSNEKISQKTAYLKQLALNHLWWFKLDSARGVYPAAMIINEAVTNSLKHAFPNQQRGTISVSLSPLDSRTYLLLIQDDGKGMPASINPAKSRSLGMSLIRGLSKQIGGTLHISQDAGTRISLTFTPETVLHDAVVEA